MSTSTTAIAATVIVTAMTAVGLAKTSLVQTDKMVGQVEGHQLRSIVQGAQAYALKNATKLKKYASPATITPADDVAGVVNDMQPTVKELATLGMLDQNLVATGSSDYEVRINGMCTAPATTCTAYENLVAMAWSSSPLLNNNGSPNLTQIAAAIRAGEGYVGSTFVNQPDTVQFASRKAGSANLQYKHPITTNPKPGRLLALANVNASPFNEYLRLDGSTEMSGSLILGSLKVSGADANSTSLLMVNNNTGAVTKGTIDLNRQFQTLQYQFVSPGDGDWLDAYDTKIPTSTHTLIIAGYALDRQTVAGQYFEPQTNRNVAVNGSPQVLAFRRRAASATEDTWHLKADAWASAPPISATTGKREAAWVVDVLVYNNNMVSDKGCVRVSSWPGYNTGSYTGSNPVLDNAQINGCDTQVYNGGPVGKWTGGLIAPP